MVSPHHKQNVSAGARGIGRKIGDIIFNVLDVFEFNLRGGHTTPVPGPPEDEPGEGHASRVLERRRDRADREVGS
jgi:hypothetical protein